jgi:cytochrome P450
LSDGSASTQSGMPRFPFPGDSVLEFSAELRRLLDQPTMTQVLLPSGHSAWLAVRYDDVRAVSTDRRFSRAEATRPGSPFVGALAVAPGADLPLISNMDPPEHTRLRKLVAGAFSPRRVEEMRSRIEQIVAERLDAVAAAGPPADLVGQLAVAVPITVICDLLGVPRTEQARIGRCSDVVISVSGHTAEEVRAAREELLGYLAGLVAAKRAHPGEDLLSALIAARDDDDRLSELELLLLAGFLLVSGHETSRNQIGNMIVILLEHPGELARLRAQPDLLPAAVEELLRYAQGAAGGGFSVRIATGDVELGGVRVRAGEAVVPARQAANRDAAVFADPDRLDVGRVANPHLTFGVGVHFCLGAQLARLELQIVLGAVLRRFPDLRLAVPATELRWRQGLTQRGLAELPVVW